MILVFDKYPSWYIIISKNKIAMQMIKYKVEKNISDTDQMNNLLDRWKDIGWRILSDIEEEDFKVKNL